MVKQGRVYNYTSFRLTEKIGEKTLHIFFTSYSYNKIWNIIVTTGIKMDVKKCFEI